MFGCRGIPGIYTNKFYINKYAIVHKCWKLDELAKYLGVFLVNFWVAKVKETTTIWTSAEQNRHITVT